jgi:hypothetical protein
MPARRYPWRRLTLLWIGVSICLTWVFWQKAIGLNFDDPDDFLRLQQVRDFLAGQSWFDLTQHRIAPPDGLAMHWSRLVDIPIFAFLLPIKPLLGQHLAEVVAVIAAPLLTLLALMAAVVAMARRLLGHDMATTILAALLPMSAPAVFLQIHPVRIDHHGWQIAFAAAAIAALVQRKARVSGIAAGIALALYLNISIEGAPFAAAALGAVGLLWALGRDDSARLTSALWTLAGGTLVLTALTGPSYRWTEGLCDAVMPSHIAAMFIAAAGTALAVRASAACGPLARLTLLGAVLLATIVTFGIASPTCLGSPFGHMDPVVGNFWYDNVVEGMPVWRQDAVSAASMIGFPLLAVIGSGIGYARALSPERQRRWAIILIVLIAALLTGAMVRRAAAVAQVIAVPGALVLVGLFVRWGEARLALVFRAVWTAASVVGLSPLMPVVAVAAFMPPGVEKPLKRPNKLSCDQYCAIAKLAALPPETILTGIDLGPILISRTPHSVYGAGYHRLERPLHDMILFFEATPDQGEAFMRRKGLRSILIGPTSEEAKLFIKTAPKGMMARLAKGPTPVWLVEDKLGSPALRLYRVRDAR